MTLTEDAPPRGRVRDAWAAAHAPVRGVSRWARAAAFAVPVTVLPSSLWRIALCTFHLPIGPPGRNWASAPSNIPGLPLAGYAVLLSIASELLAFTAVGLVARWGEVFPRWIPVLHGRSVPALGVVALASAGAAMLTLLWTWRAVAFGLGRRVDASAATGPAILELHDWQGWLAVVSYAPLLLWGPLLGAATIGYWKRRRIR